MLMVSVQGMEAESTALAFSHVPQTVPEQYLQ